MKTIEIKGKMYVPVVERVKEFHLQHPTGYIETEIVSNDEEKVVVKATVRIFGHKEDKSIYTRIFTGYSQASWKVGMMKDVALEIAETSSVGRALGFANIGLIDGIASADEMRKTKRDVSKTDTEKPPFGPGSDEEGD